MTQPELAVPVVMTSVPLPVILYLLLWAALIIGAAWAITRLFKAKAADGSPYLFWILRQVPAVQSMFALCLVMWTVLLIVVTWKQAMGGSMGPNFEPWLASLNMLTLTTGGMYVGQRVTFKREAAELDMQKEAQG